MQLKFSRARLALLAAVALLLYVGYQAVRTLQVLDEVERERDTWQRPDEIIRALDLHAGDVVVDFGAGSGYFALRLAPVVGPTGRVVAIDLRRESLAFLWIRSALRREWQVDVVRDDEQEPRSSRKWRRCDSDREHVPRAHQSAGIAPTNASNDQAGWPAGGGGTSARHWRARVTR
jgi:SAM-dependent methyltransferase